MMTAMVEPSELHRAASVRRSDARRAARELAAAPTLVAADPPWLSIRADQRAVGNGGRVKMANGPVPKYRAVRNSVGR